MKRYKILLVSFVLLIFMIGAVSASENSDSALAVENDEDVVGDLPIVINPGDMTIDDDDEGEVILDDDDDENWAPLSDDTKDIYVNDTGDDDENTGDVNSPYASLNKAFSEVSAAEVTTVHLSEGTFACDWDDDMYYFDVYHASEGGNLKIVGAGPDKTVIDGDDSYGFAYFTYGSNVILKDITFKNFRGAYFSYLESSKLTIDNCIFENCIGDDEGAICIIDYEEMSRLTITNSKFINDDNEGYTIYTEDLKAHLENNTFSNSVTSFRGGKLDLINNTFCDIESNREGAAVFYVNGQGGDIINNTFSNIVGSNTDASIYMSSRGTSKFVNNKFIECSNPSKTYSIVYLASGNYIFENNSFVDSTNSVGNIYTKVLLPNLSFEIDNDVINVSNDEINKGVVINNLKITDDMGNIVKTSAFSFNLVSEENSYTINPTLGISDVYITFNEIPENGIYNLSIGHGGEITDVLTTVNVSISNNPIDVYISPKGFGGNDGTHDSPLETIQEALDYGLSKSFTVTIHLLEGTYSGDENTELYISYKANINLIGEKYNETIIDGELEHWFLSVSNAAKVTVENITFINGYHNNNMISGSTCTLIKCIIDNCTVTNRNNAVLSNVGFDNLTFTNNNGGIISYSEKTISNSYFANNKYIDNGGVIRNNNKLTIINCKFINNTASNGGAIYAQYVNSTNSYYEGNTGKVGGAIYIYAGKSTFNNDTFVNNKAKNSDGVIGFTVTATLTETPKLFFEDCKFINNSAPEAGVLSLDTGKFTNCLFTNNTADKGGALIILIKENIPYNDPEEGEMINIEFDGVTFENNDAEINGKDILISDMAVYLNTNKEYIFPIDLTINFNNLNQSSLAGNLIANVYGPCNSVVGGNILNFELNDEKIGSVKVVNGVATFFYDGFNDGNFTLSGNSNYHSSNNISDGKISVKLENVLDSVEYWISVNGSDVDGNGSEASPFGSISYAVEQAILDTRNIIVHIGEGVFTGDLNTGLTLSSNTNITLMGAGMDKTIIDGENNTTFVEITRGNNKVTVSDLTIQNMGAENVQKLSTLKSYQINSYSDIQSLFYSLPTPIIIDEGANLYFNNVNVKNNRGGKAIIENNGNLVIDNSIFEKNGLFALDMIYGGNVVVNNTLMNLNFGVNQFIYAHSLIINNSEISNIFNTNGFSLISTKTGSIIENTVFSNDGNNSYLSIIGYDEIFSTLNPAIAINDNVTANNISMVNNYKSPVTLYLYYNRHGATLSAFGYVYDLESKNVTVQNSKFHNMTFLYSVNTQGNATFNFNGCLFDNLTWIGQSQTPGVGSTITITESLFLNTPAEVNRMSRGDREDPVCIFENNYWGNNDKPIVAFANPGDGRALSFEPETWIVLVEEDGALVFKTTDGKNSTDYEGSLPVELSYVADENGDVISVVNINGDGYKFTVDEDGNVIVNTTEVMKGIEPKFPADETVFANDTAFLITEGSNFTAVFTDKWGDPLKGKDVTILVGEEPVTLTTDENGTVTFKITQGLGQYSVNVTNPVTQESILRTISVTTDETLFASDISLKLGDDATFTAKFTDEFGKPLANTVVTFLVGEDQINATTDENGTATFDITQGLGIHAVNITNPATGEVISKSITVTAKSTIDANSSDKVQFATKIGDNTKFSVAFSDEFGKPLVNATVTFVIDGNAINATTDADGIASVEVKLDAGEHNVTVVNPLTGESFTKSATVNKTETATSVDTKPAETTPAVIAPAKPTPKIVAKKATFKAKVKTKKYTVTLKDNNGKVMKKVKLTLKVGKKTYKATTNKKGKATFKITKLTKKGKYTAKISFKETAKYAAVTKSVKITVKK